MNELILKACTLLGSQSSLAKALGVKPPVVHQWLNFIRPVPPKACVAIERATNSKVTRQELRPNDYWEIWPELPPPVISNPPDSNPEISPEYQTHFFFLKNCGRFKDGRAIDAFLRLEPIRRTEIFNTTPPTQLITDAMCVDGQGSTKRVGRS